MGRRRALTEGGFTLTELLIVVAVIGLIAAIAIPNLINTINRGRQKRSMSDMRALALAVEMYQADYSFYPKAAYGDIGTIQGNIYPTYTSTRILSDGWGWRFRYGSSGQDYTIICFARNGLADPPYVHGLQTTHFDCDIVLNGGVFTQWPDGLQSGD
jgi:general secretion pathway protein G